jgi:Holliday junction resolvase
MSKYAKGAQKERDLVKKLREDGWVATRTAGSHGPADVWAAKKGTLQFLQLKCGQRKWPSRDDRFALQVMAERAGAEPFVVFWPDRSAPEFVPPEGWPS